MKNITITFINLFQKNVKYFYKYFNIDEDTLEFNANFYFKGKNYNLFLSLFFFYQFFQK